MEPDKVYSQSNLHHLYINMQGDEVAWNISRSMPYRYCADDFVPIGMVAKELINPDTGQMGFIKTDRGKIIGTALAGHLLHLSEQNDFSLLEIFGGTASRTEQRSALTRIQLFRILTNIDETISLKHLLKSTDEHKPGSVHYHLEDIDELGLIDFKTSDKGEPVQKYKIDFSRLSKLKFNPKRSELPARVVYAIEQMAAATKTNVFTSHDITQWMQINHPEYARDSELRARVNMALQGLVKRSAAQRQWTYPATISINTIQKQKISEILKAIDGIKEGSVEALDDGMKLAKDILSSHRRTRLLVAKSKAKSRNANGRTLLHIHKLRGFLNDEAELSVKDIQRKLRENGVHLSDSRIRELVASREFQVRKNLGKMMVRLATETKTSS